MRITERKLNPSFQPRQAFHSTPESRYRIKARNICTVTIAYKNIRSERCCNNTIAITGMAMDDISQPLNGSISKEQSELHMVDEEPSRLLDLVNAIQTQVAEIQKHLTRTEQPNPSFDCQAKAIDFEGVEDTRSSVLDNLIELQDLLMTPRELLHVQAVVNVAQDIDMLRC